MGKKSYVGWALVNHADTMKGTHDISPTLPQALELLEVYSRCGTQRDSFRRENWGIYKCRLTWLSRVDLDSLEAKKLLSSATKQVKPILKKIGDKFHGT